MDQSKIIGIDMGATNIRGAVVGGHRVSEIISKRIQTQGSIHQVLDDVFNLCDQLFHPAVKAIGIGVPGLVDAEDGVVYDVVNVPSWKEVPLMHILEERYKVPVFINNDANCFALGEYYFGKGNGAEHMIGLTIGTGLGAGVIINKKLYAGRNCGAGEFGMVDYLDNNYEFYCSGSFFQNVHGLNGETVFRSAKNGDEQALRLYRELGTHLGNAIKMIMYTYDTELIILGGSVRFAYPYFEQAMWQQIRTFAFTKSIDRLKIAVSSLENSGILGAAALYYNSV